LHIEALDLAVPQALQPEVMPMAIELGVYNQTEAGGGKIKSQHRTRADTPRPQTTLRAEDELQQLVRGMSLKDNSKSGSRFK
jgi:hypothetical protein